MLGEKNFGGIKLKFLIDIIKWAKKDCPPMIYVQGAVGVAAASLVFSGLLGKVERPLYWMSLVFLSMVVVSLMHMFIKRNGGRWVGLAGNVLIIFSVIIVCLSILSIAYKEILKDFIGDVRKEFFVEAASWPVEPLNVLVFNAAKAQDAHFKLKSKLTSRSKNFQVDARPDWANKYEMTRTRIYYLGERNYESANKISNIMGIDPIIVDYYNQPKEMPQVHGETLFPPARMVGISSSRDVVIFVANDFINK